MGRLCLLIVCVAGLLASCRPAYLDQAGLAAYAGDPANGLRLEQHANGFDIAAQYRPQGLLVAQELGGGAGSLDALANKYAGQYYFVVSISNNNREAHRGLGRAAFAERLNTLAYGLADRLRLVTDAADTIPLASHAFPRTFGMGRATQFMVVFDKAKAKGRAWVQLELADLGLGFGPLRFRFRLEDLEQTPRLTLAAKAP